MKKIALTAVAVASLGLGACEASTSKNGTTTISPENIQVNTSAIGSAASNLAEGAGNVLEDTGNAIGNATAGARNEVREETRDAGNAAAQAGEATRNATR